LEHVGNSWAALAAWFADRNSSIPVDERGHRCTRGPSCGSRQNQETSGRSPSVT
jgi:hypothetical protein